MKDEKLRILVPFIASSSCPLAVERMVQSMQGYIAENKPLNPHFRADLLNLTNGVGFIEVDDEDVKKSG